MPRKPTDRYWVDWVRSIVVNDPRRSSRSIAEEAEKKGIEEGRHDYPSERTVGRIREDFRREPEEVQREYRLVYWPETFERGDLPWEAGQAVLELINLGTFHPLSMLSIPLPGSMFGSGYRPDVRFARWYWRLSQVAPHLTPQQRAGLAVRACYPSDQQQVWRKVEAQLIQAVSKPEGKEG